MDYIKSMDGKPLDSNIEFFLLRIDGAGEYHHREASKAGIKAYAEAIKDHLPTLAKDLLQKIEANECK
jgi:hypothetical protein